MTDDEQLAVLKEIRDILREQTDDANKAWEAWEQREKRAHKQRAGCLVAILTLVGIAVIVFIGQSLR